MSNPNGTEKEPARGESIPGRTYENPNEDQQYQAPDDEGAAEDGDEEHRR